MTATAMLPLVGARTRQPPRWTCHGQGCSESVRRWGRPPRGWSQLPGGVNLCDRCVASIKSPTPEPSPEPDGHDLLWEAVNRGRP